MVDCPKENDVTRAVMTHAPASIVRRGKMTGPARGYGLVVVVSLVMWSGVWAAIREVFF